MDRLYDYYIQQEQGKEKIKIICGYLTCDIQPDGFSRRRRVTAAAHTQVIKPRAAKQACTKQCTHNERPETMDQKYGRILIFNNQYYIVKRDLVEWFQCKCLDFLQFTFTKYLHIYS